MHYLVILASLAVLATATPMDMKNMKQAADTEYDSYGEYAKYGNYDDYPEGVEGAAKMMGVYFIPAHLETGTDITAANANAKRGTAETDKQAADTSYGSYGKYERYSEYGNYPGGLEEEAAKMGMTQ